MSNYWLRNVPIIIYGRTLYVNLIVISMNDYVVILGIDFLRKYNAIIDCRNWKVTFKPSTEREFTYMGTTQKQFVQMVSTMRTSRILASKCMRYLANFVDKSKEMKIRLEDIPIVKQYVEVFLE